MDQDRRAFLHDTGKFILLTGAATLAWDFVVAGTRVTVPRESIDTDAAVKAARRVAEQLADERFPPTPGPR